MYSVVIFLLDNSVECVPTSWLEGDKCYWPSKNITKKIQSQAIPDFEAWRKYKVRILGQAYDCYDSARKHLKRAEDTSNLESEDEERKRKRPSRFDGSESEEEEESEKEETANLATLSSSGILPSPPASTFQMVRKSPTKSPPSSPSATPVLKQLRRSPRKTPTNTPTPSTTPRRSPRKTPTPSVLLQLRSSPRKPTQSPDTGRRAQECNTGARAASGSNLTEAEWRDLVLRKLDAMEGDLKFLKSSLCEDEEEVLDTFLPKPLNSYEEVMDYEKTLEEGKRKKLIRALAALQGGVDGGKICRRIMRAVLTNNCMSQFSGTGQKGKKPFMETQLFKVIMSAARRASKKQIPLDALKTEVFEVLRCAPNKPGGTNYVKKNAGTKKKRSSIPEIEEDDSE